MQGVWRVLHNKRECEKQVSGGEKDGAKSRLTSETTSSIIATGFTQNVAHCSRLDSGVACVLRDRDFA
jgi:hypothetical protein